VLRSRVPEPGQPAAAVHHPRGGDSTQHRGRLEPARPETVPGYAKRLAERGRVLGISLWPYHALLAGQLVFLMLGALSLLAAFVPAHPLAAYGPPTAETPSVKLA